MFLLHHCLVEISSLPLKLTEAFTSVLLFFCVFSRGKSPELIYIILAVWTWSMLQFPLHLAGQSAFAY